jgi:hypothetical protein
LKKIFNDIGFHYDDSIFDNSKYVNKSCDHVELVESKPKNTEHRLYRNWQINQPFKCLNDVSKIDLNDNQKEKLISDPYILELYPDINSFL